MKKKTIKNEKDQKLSKLILDELGLNYNQVQKLIRNKDIKINGKRISRDIDLRFGEIIEVYLQERDIKIIFENEDLVVVFKTAGIEIERENGELCLRDILNKQLNCDIFPVHRLDRNTEGLVIFAKNLKSKKSLDDAIKNRMLEKFYLAKVIGVPQKASAKLIAYLKKDEKKGFVSVSDFNQPGYVEIRTNYKIVSSDENFSVLEVELVTGKTHQIRAHLSHIGYPILGDEKYGDSNINKKYNKKRQCLCAYKIVFHFDKNDYLNELDGLCVQLSESDIKFLN